MINGTTPPWLITTCPRSLFNLQYQQMRKCCRLDANNCALFIVTDGELQVTRDNTLFLVITGSVTSQLKNLGSEVFEDGSEIYYILKLARYDKDIG